MRNVSFIQLNLTPWGEGVLRISSDRDDRRIFWGLNFRFLDFLGLENFGKHIDADIEIGSFLGIKN